METFFLRLSAYQTLSTCSACRTVHSRIIVLCSLRRKFHLTIVFVISFVVVHVTGLFSKSNYSLAISVLNPDLAVRVNSIDFSQGLIFKFFSARAKWNLHYTGGKKNCMRTFDLAESRVSALYDCTACESIVLRKGMRYTNGTKNRIMYLLLFREIELKKERKYLSAEET